MNRMWSWVGLVCLMGCLLACTGSRTDDSSERSGAQGTELQIDSATGIPYAFRFSYPVTGFDAKKFGFGFGAENAHFCMSRNADGSCASYGHHLGRDTKPANTPVGTEVVAPADGIVRITTDVAFGGYGSDSSANPNYLGCVIVLEHEFADQSRVLTLLGHVQCESSTAYSASNKTGNPPVGSIVRLGQYVAHIAHYWSGSGQTTDWHHVHWAMRSGPFAPSSYSRSGLSDYVRGYAPASEFQTDPVTHATTHPVWQDPFVVLATHDDPTNEADPRIRSHIPGTLIETTDGTYGIIHEGSQWSSLSDEVLRANRWDPTTAVRIHPEELACYATSTPETQMGNVFIYQRPNTKTVVMADAQRQERYDVIRTEALFSWGFGFSELTTDVSLIQRAESTYASRGYRTLRPGTLVKADESSEVALVQPNNTRRPIGSGDLFDALGYGWEHVVSLPQAVIDDVAGPRDSRVFQDVDAQQCGNIMTLDAGAPDASTPFDSGTTHADASTSTTEVCDGIDNNGNGQIDEIFLCRLGSLGSACITSCGTAGMSVCTAPACTFGECRPYPENCDNTIDDDCNGSVDCADSACATAVVCSSSGTPTLSAGQIQFQYAGPSSAGLIQLSGWWQNADGTSHDWGPVRECVDQLASDGKLDCTFSVGHGAGPMVFQINLPDGRYWGDESCHPTGGCGKPIGSLTIRGATGSVAYTMTPNNGNGQPYFNGRLEYIE